MKKITSLTLGLSFLIMTYTGIILYIVPRGKNAYWSDWEFLGLTKTQYGDLHITSMVVMLIFGFLHIYYNWKPLVSYLKDKTHKISFTKKEFLIAFFINFAFVAGTLFIVQPFKAVIDLNNNIKSYWEKELGNPPYSHAEESSLKTFCRKTGIDYIKAKEILTKKGIKFSKNDIMLDIAKKNSISPNDIYNLIREKSQNLSNGKSSDIPTQLGRKTLQEIANIAKIDLNSAIKIIKEKGYSAVNAQSKMKVIADELNMTPYDLYNLLKK